MSDPKEIPIDEAHRFLRWLPLRLDIEHWERWFEARGVAHVVLRAPQGWTIYKHLRAESHLCCEHAP